MADKHLMMFLLMNEWVKIKQQGKSIENRLILDGYSSISIYGMSYIGQRLFDELYNGKIEIVYLIDKKSGGKYRGRQVISADNIRNQDSGAIIVTPIFFFEDIRKDLSGKTGAKILSLEEIIYGMTDV